MTAPQLYLEPAIQRWQPGSARDIQAAIENGALEERHWLDIKRQINNRTSDKIELARDAASFANDGGIYLIGVDENRETGELTLTPGSLAGLAERVEQILRQRCDPPLFVQCHPIPASPDDPESGFLIVEIPPSPLAPHMVDGRYHGRGDKTKYVLSDTEVERLHTIRTARQTTTQQLINAEIARDPIKDGRTADIRFYGVALPIASPPGLLTPHLAGTELANLVERAAQTPNANEWLYSLPQYAEPRAVGRGWHTYELPSRIHSPNPANNRRQADLEIADNGTITLYATTLAGRGRAAFAPNASDEPVEPRLVYTEVAVALARALITLAGDLGTTFGYRGQWHLAVGLTNLAGVHDIRDSRIPYPDVLPVRYSADQYQEGTTAGTGEIHTAPGPVLGRLMYKFTRALDKESAHAAEYRHPAETKPPNEE